MFAGFVAAVHIATSADRAHDAHDAC